MTREPIRRARFRRGVVVPLHVLLGLLVTSAAYGADDRWSVRAEGIWLSPKNDRAPALLGANGASGPASYGIEGDGSGFGLGIGYRLTPHLGLALDVASADLDVVLRTETAAGTFENSESAGFDMYLAGVDWHFAPERRLDVSVGLIAAMTKLEDLVFLTASGDREKMTFDDDVGVGLSLGIEWPFGAESRWRLMGRARSLQTILESDSGSRDLDLDPLIVSAGVAYAF